MNSSDSKKTKRSGTRCGHSNVTWLASIVDHLTLDRDGHNGGKLTRGELRCCGSHGVTILPCAPASRDSMHPAKLNPFAGFDEPFLRSSAFTIRARPSVIIRGNCR